jgi:peptidoglycan/LPS O-acetylase OafA/YrhL
VVIYHSGYLTGHDRLTPGSLAGVAVAGFFVISGFLQTWSLARNPTLKAFALKRFFRIYPLYALVILLQAAILTAEAGTLRNGIAGELGRARMRALSASRKPYGASTPAAWSSTSASCSSAFPSAAAPASASFHRLPSIASRTPGIVFAL